jgi:RecA-family ATPase
MNEVKGERVVVHLPVAEPQLNWINASDWQGQPVPPRRWLVPNRIPMSNVTILSGDGAAGKTTIAMQLAVGVVRGTDWLGAIIEEPGPVIFFTAEEDAREMHHRMADILTHHEIDFDDLGGNFHILSMPGEDCVLGAPDRAGVVQGSRLLEMLDAGAGILCPKLIVIEAAADVFAGNEIDRAQVRQFIGLLRKLAIKHDAAVLLIQHPSLTGMREGTGTSGSTGWNNSARSRMYFSKAKDDGDNEQDNEIRELKVMKSNYGPAGETVRMRWQRGVFVPEAMTGSLQRLSEDARVDQAYLACLDAATAQGRFVSPLQSQSYAPTVFARMTQAGGIRKAAFVAAQERLFGSAKIRTETTGPPSRRRGHIVRT